MTTNTQISARRFSLLGAALWGAQAVLAFFFLWAAWMKLGMPLEEAAKMAPWVATHPALAKFTGIIDLLGGLGIFFPALLRIKPRLSVLAAVGITVLQMLAMAFHLTRGEVMVIPMNVFLLVLAIFILWGRIKAVPFIKLN